MHCKQAVASVIYIRHSITLDSMIYSFWNSLGVIYSDRRLHTQVGHFLKTKMNLINVVWEFSCQENSCVFTLTESDTETEK